MHKKSLLLGGVGLVLLGVFVWLFLGKGVESTDDAAFEADTVLVAPQVGGKLVDLLVADNQFVARGTVVARIDPADYLVAFDKARAAELQAEAVASQAARDLERSRSLGVDALSPKARDQILAADAAAKAQLAVAKAGIVGAQLALSRTEVLAPMDGIVAKRSVASGALLQPGQGILTLVSASPWVVANFKETQLKSMKLGQKASLEVDAYPSLDIQGVVVGIQPGTGSRFSLFPAENATGNFVKIVQRVPVKISLTTPLPQGIVLAPGLSVVAKVFVGG